MALARALVLNPDILLLDEPLSNLDAKIRVQVRAEIRTLQRELGITTVYVTHDQEEALSLSDRVAVMRDGRVLQVAAPKELYERPATRFVADFVGTNNFIAGRVPRARRAAAAWSRPRSARSAAGRGDGVARRRALRAGRAAGEPRRSGGGGRRTCVDGRVVARLVSRQHAALRRRDGGGARPQGGRARPVAPRAARRPASRCASTFPASVALTLPDE